MKKFCLSSLAAALLVIIESMGFARGAQDLVPCNHWVYDSLTKLSLEEGKASLAINAPLTIQELRVYLNEIDYNSLSDAGHIEYDRILSYFKEDGISFKSDLLTLSLEPSVNPEVFYKTNDGIDWTFDRYSRKALVESPVSLSASDYFTFSMDIYLGQNRGMSLHDYNFWNVPLAPEQMDVNFPDTGYFSTGKKFTDKTGLSFQLGSGSKSIGRTSSGSIIWSEYLTGTAYAQLEVYSPDFRYTGSVVQFNVDKYTYSHEVEARFFDKLTVSFMESVLVYAPLELRFLNPFTIYHGMAPWRDYDPKVDDSETHTGAYLCINTQFVPVKGVRIYGLYAMTQFQTPYEVKHWPTDCTPNGIGFQLGTEVYKPVKEGYFHFNAEGYYAQPYLWIKESPNWSFVRTYSENIGDLAIFYEWIGSPFGPDTIAGELTLGYEKPQKYNVDFTYLFMAKGEMSGTKVFNWDGLDWGGQDTWVGSDNNEEDFSSWCYPDKGIQGLSTAKKMQGWITPTGIPEYVNRISSRVTLYPLSWLTVVCQPAYVFIFNHNNHEGKFAQGFEIALAVECKL